MKHIIQFNVYQIKQKHFHITADHVLILNFKNQVTNTKTTRQYFCKKKKISDYFNLKFNFVPHFENH